MKRLLLLASVSSMILFGAILAGVIPAGSAVGRASSAPAPASFMVHISLSAKAAARLSALHEGIVVAASYSGDPNAVGRKHVDEIGRIDLGREEIETAGQAGTVQVRETKIRGTKMRRQRMAWIEGPVLLNVNVYSARKSGPDNILNCDFFDGKLADGVRGPVELHCSLIEEKLETRHKE
jgi:hypothetical protein